jgi:pimeloyl-ACP methyl ester carboxylesterase
MRGRYHGCRPRPRHGEAPIPDPRYDPPMASAPSALDAWQSRGIVRRVFGHQIFTLIHGEGDADPLLVLHGFPSSSFDFHLALDELAAGRRVILHDHVGFGLSDKPAAYSYSLLEQAEVALELWRSLGVRRGHLLAHDYGTSIATEILARRERGLCPIDLASVTLCNGSVHLELAHLAPSQRLLRSRVVGPLFARLARPAIFKAQLRRILGRPGAVSDAELDFMWAGIERGDGRLRLPAISTYLDERTRFRDRWIAPLTRLDLRAHVLWGRRDPIAVVAIAERLAAEIPEATVTWLDDLGHYPMLEDPARWARAARAFVDGDPA